MSLSRSPSPHRGGGWSSPGLTPGSGASTPRGYSPASLPPGGISWAAAKAKSDEVRKYPSFSTRNSGFFSRQKHKISARLPRFQGHASLHGYVDKDIFGRGGLHPSSAGGWRPWAALRVLLRRGRTRVFLALFVLWLGYLFMWSSKFWSVYGCYWVKDGRLMVVILQHSSSYTAGHRWAEAPSL